MFDKNKQVDAEHRVWFSSSERTTKQASYIRTELTHDDFYGGKGNNFSLSHDDHTRNSS